MKFTIQIHYPAENKGRKIRATCPYWCEAESQAEALDQAAREFPGAVIGFIVPGHLHLSST